MGTPLVSGDVRVTVLSGGGIKFKNLQLKHKAPRVQMLFKLSGTDRQGLVSLEAKKKKAGAGKGGTGRGANSSWGLHYSSHTLLVATCSQFVRLLWCYFAAASMHDM